MVTKMLDILEGSGMKICPKCNQEMDDSFTVCENCGSDLIDMGEEEFSDSIAEGSAEEEAEELLRQIKESLASSESVTEPDTEIEEELETVSETFPEIEPEPVAEAVAEVEPEVVPEPEPEVVPEPVPRKRTPSTRTPSQMASRTPSRPAGAPVRRTPTRSTPKSIRRENTEEASEEKTETRYMDSAADASVTDVTDNVSIDDVSGTGASSFAEDMDRFAKENEKETPSIASRGLTQQERLQKRAHPEWDLDAIPKKKDEFIPPFVSAVEESRPSPFAPAKNSPSDDKSSASVKESARPSAAKTFSTEAGDIAVSTKHCPVCHSQCFSGEKFCKHCGYQFPRSGGLALLSAKSSNILAVLASIAMAAAVFVNFLKYTENGKTIQVTLFTRPDGYAFLALAALGAVLGFFGRQGGVIAVGVISVLGVATEDYFLYYDITQVKARESIIGPVDNELGFYLLAAGAALILIAGIYGKMQEKKRLEEQYTTFMESQ